MSVPPRWIPCPRKGQVIDGKFLPFKTPLSSRYDPELPEDARFNIDMIVSYVEGVKQLRMGLVVDLTKTDRFYDKQTLLDHSIGYHKLQCEGYGEAPTQAQVDDFNRIASHFFQQHPMEVIGVHCTHGYNRTGFLIIAYLVEKEDWDLEAAISVFAQARPPGIYKAHYLQELANRYNAGIMTDIHIPERPAWCFEEEEGYAPTDNKANGRIQNKGKRKHHDFQNENAKFVEGVHGVSVVGPPKREQIQQQVQFILKWDESGFAGSQPVSMDVQNIGLLNQKPYRVSWKADGTRFMMYIHCEGEIYMLDRDNSVFSVPQLKFLSRKRKDDHIFETLIDGELVLDKPPDGTVRPRYLIYDVMQIEKNQEVSLCDHKTRLLCATRELIEPREEAAKEGKIDKSKEPFGVRAKPFWDVSYAKWVLDTFMKDLSHENDGLIFSPAADPYKPGRCHELLKWKPSDLNTVDFKLAITEIKAEGQLPERVAQLFVGGMKERFGVLNLKIPRNREVRQYNGRIIECYWDQKTGWNFMRVRVDKSHPNGYTTAKSVCQSIVQPVTREWLLEVIEKHRWRPPAPGPTMAGIKRPHPPTTNSEQLMPPPKTVPRPPR